MYLCICLVVSAKLCCIGKPTFLVLRAYQGGAALEISNLTNHYAASISPSYRFAATVLLVRWMSQRFQLANTISPTAFGSKVQNRSSKPPKTSSM